MRIAAVAFVLSSLAWPAAALDTLRCGNDLIRVGMVAPQVVAKCGQPTTKTVENVPVRVRRPNGLSGTVGVAHIEHWVYDRGFGKFPARLTFDEGKLKQIELLTTDE